MNFPLISVLMPVYNTERYLTEAVESILSQNFADFEFIVINDGSTDGSELILKKFQQKDQRIKLISRQNQGLIATLNEGLSYAQGQYIARMDGDDIAFPERFTKQVAFLDSHPDCVAVGSQVLLIDPEGLPISPWLEKTNHDDIDRDHIMGKGQQMCHPATLFRGDILKRIGGYRSQFKHAEDVDLFLRLAEVGKLANLAEILFSWRMNEKSIGHTHRLEQQQSAILAIREAYTRRGITPHDHTDPSGTKEASLSEIHQKWAWWALGAGNVKTARKHAFKALQYAPLALSSWRVSACAIRGY